MGARAGLQAALMVEAGFRGVRENLDQPTGFLTGTPPTAFRLEKGSIAILECDGRGPVAGMARFASYATVAESFRAHALLLCTLPRYKKAMAACTDPAEFARQLIAAKAAQCERHGVMVHPTELVMA